MIEIDILEQARCVLEGLWDNYRFENDLPDTECQSTNMCVLTCLALVQYLERNGITGWQIDGGSPETGAGFRASEREDLEWHVWMTNGETIVDLTADQFSNRVESVLVTQSGDERYVTNEESRRALPELLVVDACTQETLHDWVQAMDDILSPGLTNTASQISP